MITDTALYWLHEPLDPSLHVHARAQLAILSNVMDALLQSETNKTCTQVQLVKNFGVNMSLLATYKDFVLRNARPISSAFRAWCKALTAPPLSVQELEAACEQAEQLSHQRPFGSARLDAAAKKRKLNSCGSPSPVVVKSEDTFVISSTNAPVSSQRTKRLLHETGMDNDDMSSDNNRKPRAKKTDRKPRDIPIKLQDDDDDMPDTTTKGTKMSAAKASTLTGPSPTRQSQRAKRQVVSYVDYNSSSSDETVGGDDEFDRKPRAVSKTTDRKPRAGKDRKARAKMSSDDDESAEIGDAMDDDSTLEDLEADLSDDSSKQVTLVKGKKKAATAKAPAAAKGKKKMSESFEPMNTPRT
jgi:hypothetical protein